MRAGRVVRHLLALRWKLERAFDVDTRRAIHEAVSASERTHRGELRFVVEAGMDVASVLGGKTTRERAFETFARLGVWDTEDNSGILVYVSLADRRVEIVADRGYRGAVTEAQWRMICEEMESAFRAGRYREGAVKGVLGCAEHAIRCFPSDGADPNELPDAVVFL